MELGIWRGVWRGLHYRVWEFRTLMEVHPTLSFVGTCLSASAISSIHSSLEGSCGSGIWCYRWLLENSYLPLRMTDASSFPCQSIDHFALTILIGSIPAAPTLCPHIHLLIGVLHRPGIHLNSRPLFSNLCLDKVLYWTCSTDGIHLCKCISMDSGSFALRQYFMLSLENRN